MVAVSHRHLLASRGRILQLTEDSLDSPTAESRQTHPKSSNQNRFKVNPRSVTFWVLSAMVGETIALHPKPYCTE